jgi:hypothetical protein
VVVTFFSSDSAIFAAHSASMRDLIKPEFANAYEALAKFLFEDPQSSRHSAGKFKVIG